MPDDPLERIAKGATYGGLEWTKDKLKGLIEGHRKGTIKIVTDKETFKEMEKQRERYEYKFFIQYISNPSLCQIFQAGLTLRRFEQTNRNLDSLRTGIIEMYGSQGLHIAQFIQNGLFMKYYDIVITREKTEKAVKNNLAQFFENFDKNVTFIQETDKNEQKVKEITTKIHAHQPKTYIIFGSGAVAKKSTEITKLVKKEVSNYTLEEYSATEETTTIVKKVYFLNKES
ncbi:MAG: hypothetical protein LBE76_04350 [Nitrososphaerota archaeon]|jgi:uncharacterized protein YutE (UPF0331/DUF86 family)|nr:hypothetical protein [Nitrososphaerota archaeon]